MVFLDYSCIINFGTERCPENLVILMTIAYMAIYSKIMI